MKTLLRINRFCDSVYRLACLVVASAQNTMIFILSGIYRLNIVVKIFLCDIYNKLVINSHGQRNINYYKKYIYQCFLYANLNTNNGSNNSKPGICKCSKPCMHSCIKKNLLLILSKFKSCHSYYLLKTNLYLTSQRFSGDSNSCRIDVFSLTKIIPQLY